VEANITDYLPWQKTWLVPVGDIQQGASGVDLSKLKDDINRGLDNDAYYCGLGDYLDVASPSGRQKLLAADFYDSVTAALAAQCDEELAKLQEILEPTRGRWWGLVQGHHFFDYGDGTTTDTRLAEWLGCPFLGDSAFIRPRFQEGTVRTSLDIYITHGAGSGMTQAAPISKLEKVSNGVVADLYLINHYARRGSVPRDRIRLNQRGIIESNTIHMTATGGYMKGYEQGSRKAGRAQGSYVEKAMMNPTTMGGVLISMDPRRFTRGGVRQTEVYIEVTT
jgi:hypothetical protein